MVNYEYVERITAFCPKNQFRIEMHFKSIQEAKKANPHLQDFRSLGTTKIKKTHY